ncbi:MAG: c-type cytochrome [Gemmatimonadaceae bacterium]|nr:c-type cytochrome [Gemmatimonadaceae bacterium]
MGAGKKIAMGLGMLVGGVAVLAAGGYAWASSTAASKLAATYDVHRVDFPIPFPLDSAEADSVRAVQPQADLAQIALEQAAARGKHLVTTVYVCGECHGQNFGGGVMVDDPSIGKAHGANLTLGKGSRTLTYTAADWDRMVRHGVKPSGTGTVMPSMDFFQMSDRELSDIVSYIRSLPPVDHEEIPVTLGPLGKVLVATDQIRLAAAHHPTNHTITHAVLPPPAQADAAFGKHLAQTCSGCHGPQFAGGKIIGGPPDWPPAANLTPTGLAGWSYEDFHRALTEAKSKDGRALREPMAGMPKFAKNMTDVELKALWAYISSLPPQATPK